MVSTIRDLPRALRHCRTRAHAEDKYGCVVQSSDRSSEKVNEPHKLPTKRYRDRTLYGPVQVYNKQRRLRATKTDDVNRFAAIIQGTSQCTILDRLPGLLTDPRVYGRGI